MIRFCMKVFWVVLVALVNDMSNEYGVIRRSRITNALRLYRLKLTQLILYEHMPISILSLFGLPVYLGQNKSLQFCILMDVP